MFTAIGVENTERQMENDPDAIAAEALEGVLARARDANKVQTPVNEIEVSGVNGAQATPTNGSSQYH
jgi:hypothetical protein